VPAPHRHAEAHLALFLTAVTEPLADKICGGRASGPVVDADVRQSLASCQIGDERHDRYAGWARRPQASMISGTSGALMMTPCDPRRNAIDRRYQFVHWSGFSKMNPDPASFGSSGSQPRIGGWRVKVRWI
jgi:hypothetical protein